MKKLSDYVMEFIAGLGVGHVFTLAGGGAMHLIDSLGRNRDLDYICCLHEQACAIAAEAYSQYTNNIGVALVTTGPGGTNTMTGVSGAWLDSIPVLFISGQVKRDDIAGQRCIRQMGFQEIDIVGMVRPITKYAVTVKEPNSIRYHLEMAAHMAKSDRPGPVWIDIPLDVQAAMIDENQLWGLGLGITVPEAGSELVTGQILRSIEALNRSERPVILAGNGIRLSGALDEFSEFIGELNIPVLTTWKAIDFMAEDHPLYAGRPGAIGQRAANFAQQNSDWLLSIGARLDLGQTAYTHKYFARAAYKTIVDIDINEINKLQMSIDAPVQADAGEFIREFMRNRHKIIRKDRSSWFAKIKEWRLRYPVILPDYWNERDLVNDYVLIDVLSDEMSSSDLFVPGSSGACSERSMQAFRVKEGMRIFNTEGLGSMGFGVPAALGGCVASGGKNTVCIEGDGGFAMNIQDLETVRRLNLPIKFFVLNNQGYGSIINTQKNYFNGNYVGSTKESGLTLPDFKAVGAAFGMAVCHINNHEKIREQVREVLQHDGPVVCEVMVSAEQQTMPRVTSKQTPEGSMVSMPMEDMWPFLDRDEFRANMIAFKNVEGHSDEE
jgi:acetolactate synthase I/II/III large subunit